MESESEKVFEIVVFAVARLIFGSEFASFELYRRIVARALIGLDLHIQIADTLGEHKYPDLK